MFYSIEEIEGEFGLPGLGGAYHSGTEQALLTGGSGKDEYSMTIHPFDEEVRPGIRDKGFRLRLTMPNLEGPNCCEIFFNEEFEGNFRQSGFYRPRDKFNHVVYPRLENDTLRAFVRRLMEYTPAPVTFPNPQP